MDMDQYERRRILPSFPIEGQFKTMKEVDDYLSEDKIQCLLCGRYFHIISTLHLNRIHHMTADEYRELYGIPWNRALIGTTYHEKCVISGKKLVASGKLRPPRKGEILAPKRSWPRPRSACVVDDMKRWRRGDYEAVLEKMLDQQRTFGDVCGDPDLPGMTACCRYKTEHPEFVARLQEVNHRLPYPLQAVARIMSPRFRIDCERLFARGMTKKDIAGQLGVSRGLVMRILRRSDEERRPARKKVRKYTREDFEAILNRVGEQRRSLRDVSGDPDLPSSDAWKNDVKKHPEFTAKLLAAYHSMPYSFQGKVQNFSHDFRIDCERLRARGMSHKNIARKFGVSDPTVRRALREFNKKMGLDKPAKWRRNDFEAILNRIREERRSLREVCGDPDLPSLDSWAAYIKKHPEFTAKRLAVYHSLPYAFQGKVKNFSPDFRIDCERLRARGMSYEAIARKFGVSVPSVVRVLREFDKKTRFKKPKRVREDFEAILERIRKQSRTLDEVCRDRDLPNRNTWDRYEKKHPEFAVKLREVYHGMPLSFQVRLKNYFSPRLYAECKRLRVRGMSLKNIAKTLGVSLYSVRRHSRELDKKMGFGNPKKYHGEDFEAILDRIRDERRPLHDVCKDPDLPGRETCARYLKKHPEFAIKLREIHHGLPYSFQAKVSDFSPRFRIDCERLRAGGMTLVNIGKNLEVSKKTVARALRGFCEERSSRNTRKRKKEG